MIIYTNCTAFSIKLSEQISLFTSEAFTYWWYAK